MRIILHGLEDSAQLNGERYLLQQEEHFANDSVTFGQRRFVWRSTDGVGRFSNDSMGAAIETMQRARATQLSTAPRHWQQTTYATAESNGQWFRLMKVGDSYVWYSLRTGDHHPALGVNWLHNSISNAVAEMRRVQEDERAAAAQARIFGAGTPQTFEDFAAEQYRGDFRWTQPVPRRAPISPNSLILDVVAYRNLRGELVVLQREAPVTDPTNVYFAWRKPNGHVWLGLHHGGRATYSNQEDAIRVFDTAMGAALAAREESREMPLDHHAIRAIARWGDRWYRLQLLDYVEQYGWTRADTTQTDYIWRPLNTVAEALEFMRNEQVREREEVVPDESVWGDWPTPEGVLYNESLLRRAERYTMDPHEFVAATRRASLVDPGHGGPIPTERPLGVWPEFAHAEEERADRIYRRVQEAFRTNPAYDATELEPPMNAPITLEEVFGTMRANRAPVYPPAQTQAPMHTKNVNKP